MQKRKLGKSNLEVSALGLGWRPIRPAHSRRVWHSSPALGRHGTHML